MSSLNLRQFLFLTGAGLAVALNGCALAGVGRNQAPAIGYLSTGSPTDSTQASYKAAFVQGLAELGYVEGQTIAIEWRYADARTDPADNLNAMAAELVARNVLVIVTSSTPGVVAAARATRTIPIVSGGPSRGLTDLGLVESDAHPGGNVTGTGGNTDVYSKLVELLKETVPSVTRIGYLRNPNTPGSEQQMARSQTAAESFPRIARSDR